MPYGDNYAPHISGGGGYGGYGIAGGGLAGLGAGFVGGLFGNILTRGVFGREGEGRGGRCCESNSPAETAVAIESASLGKGILATQFALSREVTNEAEKTRAQGAQTLQVLNNATCKIELMEKESQIQALQQQLGMQNFVTSSLKETRNEILTEVKCIVSGQAKDTEIACLKSRLCEEERRGMESRIIQTMQNSHNSLGNTLRTLQIGTGNTATDTATSTNNGVQSI